MALYSHNGKYPTVIPFRIVLPGGFTRTDPATFTDEELLDAGYTEVESRPTPSSTQVVEWDTNEISWVLRDKTPEELAAEAADLRLSLRAQIDDERDRRILNGFLFNGDIFDSRPEDQKRISGAGTLAFVSIVQGIGTPGNYFWHGEVTPFVWITKTNSLMPLDAPSVIELGKAAAKWESQHVFAARALKDMSTIPADFANDAYWPAVVSTVDESSSL